MKKWSVLTVFLLAASSLFAQQTSSVSDKINAFFEPIVNVLAMIIFWDPIAAVGIDLGVDIPIVVIWLVFGALFFTIKMNFVNIRGFKHAIELVQGKFVDQ